MALAGRLHPLLIHFPIALVLAAVIAEAVALTGDDARWRTVATANAQAGALFAVLAAAAGWLLAGRPGGDTPPLLEWHRWIGSLAAVAAVVAAATASAAGGRGRSAIWMYRLALAGAGLLVAIAGHLGGVLVWGADFFRP
jgi:uncharacterized membrane protein